MQATEEEWLLEQFGDEYKSTANRSIAAFHGFPGTSVYVGLSSAEAPVLFES